uniref:Uncharacterized protein n=1 Tax=Ixodes ricinus TaxID=34613 RepID=A0A147BT84_IXORI
MSLVPSPSLLYTVLSAGGRTSSPAPRGVAASSGTLVGLPDWLLEGLPALLTGLCSSALAARPLLRAAERGAAGRRSGEADGVRGGVSGGVRGPRLLGSGERPAPFLAEDEALGLRWRLRLGCGDGVPAFTALILIERLSSCVPLSPPRSFR